MNCMTHSRVGSTRNWPFGLFLSEPIFASIVFGAIPVRKNPHDDVMCIATLAVVRWGNHANLHLQ